MTTGDVPPDGSAIPPAPPQPAVVAPPAPHPPGILPALPERRAWPWALLFAFLHHLTIVVGVFVFRNQSQAMSAFLALAAGLVPFAFVLGLILIARKISFPGRLLMFSALFSVALLALEVAVAAGVCIFAMGNSGFH